jgi:hypothetical protein
MKFSNKIIEVTVSMLLAAISIVIAYTSYRIVSGSYRQFDSKNKKISEFLLADKLIKKDMSVCTKAIRTENGMSLLDAQGEIRYAFYPDYILRDQYHLHTDTLLLRSAGLTTVFENQEVFEDQLIDKIHFEVSVEDRSIELTYLKNYSADELFK